jgi:hypothetical protein
LWCGEISRDLFEDENGDEHFDASSSKATRRSFAHEYKQRRRGSEEEKAQSKIGSTDINIARRGRRARNSPVAELVGAFAFGCPPLSFLMILLDVSSLMIAKHAHRRLNLDLTRNRRSFRSYRRGEIDRVFDGGNGRRLRIGRNCKKNVFKWHRLLPIELALTIYCVGL